MLLVHVFPLSYSWLVFCPDQWKCSSVSLAYHLAPLSTVGLQILQLSALPLPWTPYLILLTGWSSPPLEQRAKSNLTTLLQQVLHS